MIQVLVQVGAAGAQKVLDITEAVTGINYRSTRTVAPVRCEIALMPHNKLSQIDMGNVLQVKDDGVVLHNGYVFRKRQTVEGLSLTTYDQIRYLENEDTVVLEDKTVTQIVEHYATNFGLHVGSLADTGFAIPTVIEPSKAIVDIINEGLLDTVQSTGQLYTLYDDNAQIYLKNLKEMFLPYTFTSDSSVFSYDSTISIDDNVFNQFKVVRQNPDAGTYDTYVARDGDKIGRWGLLQMVHEVPEEYSEDMINQLLDTLAGLYGDPVVTMDVRALGLRGLRGGNSVHFDMPGTLKAGWYLVDEVRHSYGDSGHMMDMRLLGVG